jgi:hypothetical protein
MQTYDFTNVDFTNRQIQQRLAQAFLVLLQNAPSVEDQVVGKKEELRPAQQVVIVKTKPTKNKGRRKRARHHQGSFMQLELEL